MVTVNNVVNPDYAILRGEYLEEAAKEFTDGYVFFIHNN